MKLGYNWLSDFRGDAKNCQNMRVLVQRSKNDFYLLYSQIFINSFSQLHIPVLGQIFKISMESYELPFFHC